MEHRTAFARAWSFLNYTPVAKAAARIAAVATGLLTVALLAVLGLFLDLLVSRGKIPAYRDLNETQRAVFRDGVTQLSPERLSTALEHVEGTIPGNRDFDSFSDDAREHLWRAYVWHILDDQVHPVAGDVYSAAAKEPDGHFGVLSLVTRSIGYWVHPVVAKLASWNYWTWHDDPARGGNFWFLTGLLILGVVLAIVRALAVYSMNYFAAVATQEAATRLRRAVYHHTFRLGTLSVRALGPSEAISMFTRHVENVHDALFARLTALFCEPLQVALLLVFALTIHFWLALAFLLFAVILVLVGGRIASEFHERSKHTSHQSAGQLALLQESLAMMRLVKGNAMELFNQARVERQLSEYSKAQLARVQGESFLGR